MDNITVRVIDADEANRNFLGQLLQKKSCKVKHVSSGTDGVRMVEEAPPGMVIFDPNLPISVKFSMDAASIVMKQAAIEMSQNVAKMQAADR